MRRLGYHRYDVVSQLDADHVPAPDYLRRIVTPFVDEHVGYVAAPSVCDRNADRSWSARGRLFAEAVLHGPMQAGHSGGFAPSCIGSHYAIRTAALKQIGGIGPELAEDFTTTLMMSSHGWQGVFAIDAEAHGDGPECLEDCVTQEFQWSRSMMNVLLGVNGDYWRGLSRRAKLRLGFCQLWYPLFGVLMLASVVLPLAAILTRTPLMEVGLGDFYRHVVPSLLALVGTVVWLRTLDWLRPRTARAFSWEIVLFQLVRWPWALLGCLHAVAGRIVRREFGFKVTPKGRTGLLPLPARVLAPYLLLAVASAAPTIAGWDPGRAAGYRALALLNAGLYLLAAIAIVVLHVREHPSGTRRAALRSIRVKALATLACTVALVAGLVQRDLGLRAAQPAIASTRTPYAAAVAPAARQLGVTTRALAENMWTPWVADDLGEVNAFEHVRARPRRDRAVVRRLEARPRRPRPARRRSPPAAARRRSRGSRGTTPAAAAASRPTACGGSSAATTTSTSSRCRASTAAARCRGAAGARSPTRSTHTWVRSLVWFDLPKQLDWRVATSPQATAAFADGVARMQGRAAGAAPATRTTPAARARPDAWLLVDERALRAAG